MEIIYSIFSALYVFFLPGYLLALRTFNNERVTFKLAMGLGLSVVLMPILLFATAMLLKTVVTKDQVLLIASAINVLALFAGSRK